MSLRAKAVFRPRSSSGQFVKGRISPAVKAGVQESMEHVQALTVQKCPVDTGVLQASYMDPTAIQIVETDTTVKGSFGTDVFYAPYVEFGTGIAGAASPGAGPGPYSSTWPGMPAQPHIRPAIDESKEAIKDIMANDLRVALK